MNKYKERKQTFSLSTLRPGCSDREGEADLQRHRRLHGPRRRLPAGEAVRGQRRRQQVQKSSNENLTSSLFCCTRYSIFFPMRLQSHYHKEQRHHPHVDRVHPRIWATATSVPGKKMNTKKDVTSLTSESLLTKDVSFKDLIDWAKASVSQQHSPAIE